MSKITDAVEELLSGPPYGVTRWFRVTTEGVTEIDPTSIYIPPDQRGRSPAFEPTTPIPWDEISDSSPLSSFPRPKLK